MKIFFANHFKNQLIRLKGKYPRVKSDLLKEIDGFNPHDEIHIGRSIYKVRIRSSDMQRGKSGGFRSYVYLYIRKNLLLPLCIYAKNQKEDISETELKCHFDAVADELLRLDPQ